MKEKNSKIANLQFILSIFIVLIHASCLFINVPGQELQMVFGPNWASFLQLYIGEGVCRVAVPLFFIFSGYLFYVSFDGSLKKYAEKLRRRMSSLVIPYLFWSLAVFIAFFMAQRFLGLNLFFTTRNDSSVDLRYLLDNIVFGSFDSPLWYCRYLIVFSVLAIVMYWPLKVTPRLSMALCTCLYFFNGRVFSIPFRENAVFFYCLGAVIALHSRNFSGIVKKVTPKVSVSMLVLFVISLVMRSYYFCFQDPNYLLSWADNVILDYSGKICIIIGVIAIWFGYDLIFNSTKIWKVSDYSFLIFAAHHPIVSMIKKLILARTGVSNTAAVFSFISSTVITVGMILVGGAIVKRFAPHIWKIATGNR